MWADSVTLGEIARQRALGWPDFHPETFCHRCGHRNLWSWFVDSALWGVVLDDEIVCPPCFVGLYEDHVGGRFTWELSKAETLPAIDATSTERP